MTANMVRTEWMNGETCAMIARLMVKHTKLVAKVASLLAEIDSTKRECVTILAEVARLSTKQS